MESYTRARCLDLSLARRLGCTRHAILAGRLASVHQGRAARSHCVVRTSGVQFAAAEKIWLDFTRECAMRHAVRKTANRRSRSKSKGTEVREENEANVGRPRLGRSERLNARIAPGDQALLAKVAGMQGVSVSTFVIQAARARAKALLRRRRLIRLSSRDQQTLIRALLSPAEPNAALARAAASHARELARRSIPEPAP